MRDCFPIFQKFPNWAYLDSAATSQKPRKVMDALLEFYTSHYATVHRAVYSRSLKATDQYAASRESARRFLNAKHLEEIVFTRGTTDALNLVAMSYGKMVLQPGDEILVSQMEHHSNIVPWQLIAEETKASIRWIPIDDEGNLLWDENLISSKTKIIAIAHMSNVTGTIHPIQEIARAAHAKGAVLVVDGAQAAPHLKIDVQALDCDFYAFSGHKCYGPTGIGILYGKKSLLEKMPPIQGGGDMIVRVDLDKTTYADPPIRFEAGTPSIGSAIALKHALEFIEECGKENIIAHEDALFRYAEELLAEIKGLKILGNAKEKGPILTFYIEGIHPLDLATMLDLNDISIRSGHLCAQPLLRHFGLEAVARASFAVYNTKEEVERFAAAIQRNAAVLVR